MIFFVPVYVWVIHYSLNGLVLTILMLFFQHPFAEVGPNIIVLLDVFYRFETRWLHLQDWKSMPEIPPRDSTQEDCKEGNETYNYHFILLPIKKSYFVP